MDELTGAHKSNRHSSQASNVNPNRASANVGLTKPAVDGVIELVERQFHLHAIGLRGVL